MSPQDLASLLNEIRINDGESSSTFDFATPLREQDVDSMTMTSLFFEIEDKLDMSFPDEEVDKLTTINAISKYLEK